MQLHAWLAALSTCVAAGSLRETISQHESLHLLDGILDELKLYSTFADFENTTLFAMTDTAIHFLADWGINLTNIDTEIAESILKYHLVDGIYSSTDLSKSGQSQIAHSILAPPHFTNVSTGAAVKLGGGHADDPVFVESGLQKVLQVVDADVHYDGGVIHTIDSNLVLPHNLSETTNVGGLHNFWNLVEKSGANVKLESLQDATFLIPHNEAVKLQSNLDKFSQSQLADVVAYHAVPNRVLYSRNISEDSRTYKTLHGLDITVERSPHGHILVNQVRVVREEVLVYGGVAHIIDGVLMPSDMKSSGVHKTTSSKGAQLQSDKDVNAEDKPKSWWLLDLLAWPSIADIVFYIGLLALFCGTIMLRLLHWQDAGREPYRKLFKNDGDASGIPPRTSHKDCEPDSVT
ncbi:Fasciclin-like arabinogalactan protein [Pseudocercospora fuligena]|uniref:Fasciclin-like arabinogalactan protein n=1 Tax=Pseudocercospora fuligena TaxID=685502 RepID=A0A8H6RV81_9PEZI|nr:Fasciclin-like arabinogalactan protein [Pseudocercospora fuligena]